MAQLFLGALLRAYKEFEERVGAIEHGRGVKFERIRAEILKRQPPFSISTSKKPCPGISRDMVRVVLRAMKMEGLITPTGKGRSEVVTHQGGETNLNATASDTTSKSVLCVAANPAHGLAKSIWWQIAWSAWLKQFNGTKQARRVFENKTDCCQIRESPFDGKTPWRSKHQGGYISA